MTFGEAALAAARLGCGVLGWSPDDFWRATPAELRAALGIDLGAADALDAAGLRRLIEEERDGRAG